MAYHLSVVEILEEINQQDTPPSLYPPYTRNHHNSIVYLYQMNGCDDKFIKDFDIDSFYEKNVQYVLR